jgi:TonB family protein
MNRLFIILVVLTTSFIVQGQNNTKKNENSSAAKTYSRTEAQIAADDEEYLKVKQLSEEIFGMVSSCRVTRKESKCCTIFCHENLYTINEGLKDVYSIAVFEANICTPVEIILVENLEAATIGFSVATIEQAFDKIKEEQKKIATQNQTTLDAQAGISNVVEEQAEFPGGLNAMMQYMKGNVNYPPVERSKGISGKCFLKFIINTDGSITDVTILQGIPNCEACDKEAVRVIKAMPRWKPAKLGGKPVRCYFNLPFTFKISK